MKNQASGYFIAVNGLQPVAFSDDVAVHGAHQQETMDESLYIAHGYQRGRRRVWHSARRTEQQDAREVKPNKNTIDTLPHLSCASLRSLGHLSQISQRRGRSYPLNAVGPQESWFSQKANVKASRCSVETTTPECERSHRM